MKILLALTLSCFLLLGTLIAPVQAYYYPSHGDMYYNGYYYADSYMKWYSPGPWSVNDPGYEHDLNVSPTYFNDCTTTTTLPDGYDDCPTAGWQDGPHAWAFSFGTYDAKLIQPNTWYYGSWTFSGGNSSLSNISLTGQENQHEFCGYDDPWCMNGIRSYRIMFGWFVWGSSYFNSWTII